MNEKDFNLGILLKLYEIAKEVFAKHVIVPEGSYTANDLAKMGTKIFEPDYLKMEEKTGYEYNKYTNDYDEVRKDCFVAPMASVEYLTFSCSFCIAALFGLVAKFEKLAAIGGNRHIFTRENDLSNVLCKVVVEINKEMGTLANFVAKDNLRPVFGNVCLDIEEHKAMATTGWIAQVKYLTVVDKSEYNEGVYRPLVPAKDFKKMCALAGKQHSARMVCTLVQEGEKQFWICRCKGIASKVEAEKYPNINAAVKAINRGNIVSMSDDDWKVAKKWIKKNMGVDSCDTKKMYITNYEGRVSFIIRDVDFGRRVEYIPRRTDAPSGNFTVCVNTEEFLKVCGDHFYIVIPSNCSECITSLDCKSLSICMPKLYEIHTVPNKEMDANLNYDCWRLPEGNEYPWRLCGFLSKEEIAAFDASIPHQEAKEESANECAESVERDTLVSSATECAKVAEGENNAPKTANKKQGTVTKSVTTKEQRKFSFDKVGVRVGDILVFVDGKEVLAADNNKVEYGGRLYTLSGFTREFIPNPTKSGAYRGCAFFTYNGVKLEKLFRNYLNSLDSESEEVEAAKEVEETKDVTLDDERKQLPPPPPVIYLDVDTLVSTAAAKEVEECDEAVTETVTEAQKVVCAPPNNPDSVIAPSDGESSLYGKEKPQRAIVYGIGVNALLSVALTSLVAHCKATDPPHIIGGVAKVVRSHGALASCNCKQTAGKVVHELPLPPPKKNKLGTRQ